LNILFSPFFIKVELRGSFSFYSYFLFSFDFFALFSTSGHSFFSFPTGVGGDTASFSISFSAFFLKRGRRGWSPIVCPIRPFSFSLDFPGHEDICFFFFPVLARRFPCLYETIAPFFQGAGPRLPMISSSPFPPSKSSPVPPSADGRDPPLSSSPTSKYLGQFLQLTSRFPLFPGPDGLRIPFPPGSMGK